MNRAVFLSRNFPPMLGGTCTLYSQIYRRWPPQNLTVLTSKHLGCETFDEAFPHPVIRRDFSVHSRLKPFEWMELGLRLVPDCRKLLRRGRTNELHAATTFPEGVAGLAAKRLFGTRFILWVAGEEANTFRNYRLEGPLQRAMMREADRVVAISQNTAEICQELGAADNLRLVLPGVDLHAFTPQPMDAAHLRKQWNAEAYPLLVTVGRLQQRKGHDMVLRALPAIRQRFPNVRYLIVGDSTGAPPADAANLRRLVTELRLESVVEFVGGVPSAHLPGYYTAADLFVMPNRQIGGDVEGFGLTFLEAAACGTTSIAGRSGGAVDAVLHNETGWLVDPNQSEKVAEGILQVLSDPDLRCRLEQTAQVRAKTFGWDAVYNNFRAAIT